MLNLHDARSIGGMWLGNLAALVIIVAGLPQIPTTPPPPPHLWYTTIPLTLGVIALPLGPVIQRNLRRWWLHRFGTELVSETARAEDTLRRIAPPPAPRRSGPASTAGGGVASALRDVGRTGLMLPAWCKGLPARTAPLAASVLRRRPGRRAAMCR